MLAREGESVDFRKIVPDPVPDDQNFCAIPALKDIQLAPEKDDDNSPPGLERMRLMKSALPEGADSPDYSRGAISGKPVALNAWAAFLRKSAGAPAMPDSADPARDVLASLSGNDALVSDLSLGLPRPYSQWTPSWTTLPLPDALNMRVADLAPFYRLDPMLCLRAAAEARVENDAEAHQSLLIAVRISQAIGRDPSATEIGLIGSYILSGLICNTVWELCDAHCGSADDFRTLQGALSQLDFKQFSLRAERTEMDLTVNTIERLKRTQDGGMVPAVPFPSLLHYRAVRWLLPHLIPDGWFDANAALLAQWYHDYLIKPLRDDGYMEFRARVTEFNSLVEAYHSPPPFRQLGDMLISMMRPSFSAGALIYNQSLVNESIAACAIERYRIEHGIYPDTLEAANRARETSIPLDIVSGKPMGYRKTAAGRYVLWCVGFTGKDNGGKRVLEKEYSNFSSPPGDWVWDFPN